MKLLTYITKSLNRFLANLRGLTQLGREDSAISLTDVDKESVDRGTPTPNTSDVIIDGASKAHKTISSHYSTDADTNTQRLQMQNKQIVGNNGTSQIVNYGVQSDGNFALKFFDANGVGVARFGQYEDGTIALKVAKSGQEVDTATDSNLIFNSAQDIFKIVGSGTLSLSGNTGTFGAGSGLIIIASGSYTHGLGYVPGVLIYGVDNNGNETPISSGVVLSGFSGSGSNIFAFSIERDIVLTSSTISFSLVWRYTLAAGTSSQPWAESYKFYFLQETAN